MKRRVHIVALSPALRGAIAAAIFCAISYLIFGRGLHGAFTTRFIGSGTDPSAFFWFLAWWPYALGHHLNPMFTDLLWAPHGISLAWGTPIPLPAAAAAPITLTAGPIAAYNVLCLIAAPAAAFSAYLLCAWITKKFWPSVLGGAIFGFSAYMFGQTLAHVDIVMVFPIPLMVLVALKYFAGEIRTRAATVTIALLMAAQFLCFPELYATTAMFAAIAFVIALWLWPDRGRVVHLAGVCAAALGLSALILSPYLYAMLMAGIPRGTYYPPGPFAADLLGLIVPERFTWLGNFAWIRGVSDHFAGNWIEHGACFGFPLLIVAEAWRRSNWTRPECKIAVAVLAAIVIAALGPALMVAGRPTFPMPWAIATHLPLIANALPGRFAMYAFLILAIIAASWFASSTSRREVKALALAGVILMMLPRMDAVFWSTQAYQPAMFADGSWRKVIAPDSVILPLPFERNGSSMLWQASAKMGFRMASGYTSITPESFRRYPAARFFLGSFDLPEVAEQVKAFVAQHDIAAIVIDDRDPDLERWCQVLEKVGLGAIEMDGARVYAVPPGAFAAYRDISVVNLEARALALRSGVLIRAIAAWLDAGGKPAAISPEALKAAGLLPADWSYDRGADGYRDYALTPVGRARLALVMGGTYVAMKPLIERLRPYAAAIYLPYPTLWQPDIHYPADTRVKVVFEFDSHEIKEAAQTFGTPQAEQAAGFWPRTESLSSAK